MKPTRRSISFAAVAGIALAIPASAAVSIDWATVGNVGNANDTTGYGGVAYAYKIAKNETTIAQYTEFLNAAAKSDPYALYSTNMASTTFVPRITRSGSSGSYSYAAAVGSENKPISYVSWFDAARFCNWMHNGQGSGSTEDGAYTLNGAMSGIYTKNAQATVWIPSENEWYKAAYYDATKGGAGGYWMYPTQSNTLSGNTVGVANSANYYDGDYVGYPGIALTDVGAYGANSDSFYGTNDQGGNLLEWNDGVLSGPSRGVRGSCWGYTAGNMVSSYRIGVGPSEQNSNNGFRVASVPEPGCLVLTILAGGMLVTRRKR